RRSQPARSAGSALPSERDRGRKGLAIGNSRHKLASNIERPTDTRTTQRRRQVMSKRFQRWVETWIEDNVNPHSNTDIESYAARAERLANKLLAEASGSGFSKIEIEEERARVLPMVKAAVSSGTDFDIDAYQLASELAQEHEDGD